ncbi:MAG: CBS domain-containing protein [Hyphomicrobiaceae bacterium]|nr:CBS domain-containing protein [Hyphomicrobiaceae bacterium]
MYKFLERQVGQYMTRNPRSVSSSLTLGELEALFESHDFNAFPVVDGGKLVGLVTKFDFLKAFAFAPTQMVPHYDELMKKTVADVMSRAVVHVEESSPLPRALQLMVELRARSFPVLDASGNLVGVIAREDLMTALKETAAA